MKTKQKKTSMQLNKEMNVRMWIYIIVLYASFIALLLSTKFVNDNTAGFIILFSLTPVIVSMIVAICVEAFIMFKREMNEIKKEREERAMFKQRFGTDTIDRIVSIDRATTVLNETILIGSHLDMDKVANVLIERYPDSYIFAGTTYKLTKQYVDGEWVDA